MTYEESLALLRRLGDLHGDAARKAIRYSIAGDQAMACALKMLRDKLLRCNP